MKKLTKDEMIKISGGSSYLSSTLISALTRAGSTIFEIGRALGSTIRRMIENDKCSL